MNGWKSSCLTLVAIAGASAVIAGGVLVASPAGAEPTRPASVSPPVIASSTVVTAPEIGSPEPFDAARRASMIVEFDPADDSWINAGPLRDGVIAIGPDPCDSCDPLDIDNPESPDYDPSVLAVYQEDDNLPPPEGPGFDTCNGLSVTGPFWAGANDQCSGANGASGADVSNVETFPAFTAVGQHYAICGQTGRIDTSGFVGDPNNPGGPLKTEDIDVWELHLTQEFRVKITAYFQAPELACHLCVNFDTVLATGISEQLQDCEERYGLDGTSSISDTAACVDGVLVKYREPGFYYLVVDPRSDAAQGDPGNQLCEYWYNIEVEVLSAEYACCIDSASGITCVDGLTPNQCADLGGSSQSFGPTCATATCPVRPCCFGSVCAEDYSLLHCEALGGISKAGQSCATVTCTPNLGACCFSCTGTVVAPCPDPSGPILGCAHLTAAQCLAAGGLYLGVNTTCIQGIGGPCDCAGDINGDGDCNTSDFNILAGQFGQGNPSCRTHAQGDLNCDGLVNTSDFNILAGSFGCIRN